jgi:beta-fructofuranosidase
MLITARARDVPEGVDADDRAVVGYATSTDLIEWTAREPLSAPGAGFAHLEVLQLVAVDGRDVLVFSCDSEHLAGHRTGGEGGVWYVPLPHGIPFDGSLIDLTAARRVTGDELYAARIVAGPAGAVLLGFENIATDGSFVGRVSDPIPVSWDDEGRLVAQGTRVAA